LRTYKEMVNLIAKKTEEICTNKQKTFGKIGFWIELDFLACWKGLTEKVCIPYCRKKVNRNFHGIFAKKNFSSKTSSEFFLSWPKMQIIMSGNIDPIPLNIIINIMLYTFIYYYRYHLPVRQKWTKIIILFNLPRFSHSICVITFKEESNIFGLNPTLPLLNYTYPNTWYTW